jgi:hypothetical protein
VEAQGRGAAPAPAGHALNRAQVFVTGLPPRGARAVGSAADEPGGVTYTDDQTLADYSDVANELTATLGHVPSVDEIEREYRLRGGGGH